MLGGNAWNTGGSIAETSAPAGYAIEGFQLRFDFNGLMPKNMPLQQIFASKALRQSNIYLDYGYADNFFHGNWGTISSVVQNNPAEVPEPHTVLLTLLAMIGLVAFRRQYR